MAYTDRNFKTKKALVEAFKAGESLTVYNPGPFGGAVANGRAVIEGPHYPAPHKFFVAVVVESGKIVKLAK